MLLIRPAEMRDVLRMEQIESQSFSTPHWRAGNFLTYDCIVAEVQGTVAGFVVSRVIFDGHGTLPSEREILNLAVDPDYRKLGVGSALMRAALEYPSNHFFLEVRESNAAARQLYEKLGFKEAGRRRAYYSNPTETAIVMRLK